MKDWMELEEEKMILMDSMIGNTTAVFLKNVCVTHA